FSPDHLGLIANTLMVAVATATLAVAFTFVAAWLAVRREPGGWGLEWLGTLPLVFSRLVLGLAVVPLVLPLSVPAHRTLRVSVLGLRHQLPAVWNALRRLRHAADPPRARGIRGNVRRIAGDAACAHRGAAAGAGTACGLVVHLPDGRARAVAGDPAGGAALAD